MTKENSMKKKIAVIGMLALMMGGLLIGDAEARRGCNDNGYQGRRWDNNRFERRANRIDNWRDRRVAMINNRWDNRRDRNYDRYDRFRDRRGWW